MFTDKLCISVCIFVCVKIPAPFIFLLYIRDVSILSFLSFAALYHSLFICVSICPTLSLSLYVEEEVGMTLRLSAKAVKHMSSYAVLPVAERAQSSAPPLTQRVKCGQRHRHRWSPVGVAPPGHQCSRSYRRQCHTRTHRRDSAHR